MKRVKMTMKVFGAFTRRYEDQRISNRSIGVLYSRHSGNVFVVQRDECESSHDFFWMLPGGGFMPVLNVGNMKFSDPPPKRGVLYEIIVVPDGEEDYSELKEDETSGKSLCI